MNTTPRQRAILREALGINPNGTGTPSQNIFATQAGSEDYMRCDALVGMGFMDKLAPDAWANSNYRFRVTEAGMKEAMPQKFETPTGKHLEILCHALGVTEFNKVSNRNYFCTGEGSDDYDACMQLVELGYMTRAKGNAITGGDYLFRVTPAGKGVVLPESVAVPEASPAKPEDPKKIDIVCADCGSHDVSRTSESKWNTETQEWEQITVYDDATCNCCGGEVTLKEIPLDNSPLAVAVKDLLEELEEIDFGKAEKLSGTGVMGPVKIDGATTVKVIKRHWDTLRGLV